MITKRELSGRRELKNIASVFDTVKCQRDKLLGCLEWYWFYWDCRETLNYLYSNKKIWHALNKETIDELDAWINCAYQNFDMAAEEIRMEMEGE